jgi:uncharacterized protein (TIGR02453 family)
MAFSGFPPEAIDFYLGLEADNSKEYWQAHKSVYETAVKGPFDELLKELAPEFGAGKIFRPYRDVRFSADKSPYKTSAAAALEGGGYVQLSADGLGCGSGMYMLAPDQLDRYRKAVADERTGAEIESIAATLRKAGAEISAHDALKTIPRGYPKDHPRADLLRNKGLIAWTQWEPAPWLHKPAAKKKVADFLRGAGPLNQWLERHVGPSAMADDRRR